MNENGMNVLLHYDQFLIVFYTKIKRPIVRHLKNSPFLKQTNKRDETETRSIVFLHKSRSQFSFKVSIHEKVFGKARLEVPAVDREAERGPRTSKAAFRRLFDILGRKPSSQCCPGSSPPKSRRRSRDRRSRERGEVAAVEVVRLRVQEIWSQIYVVRQVGS